MAEYNWQVVENSSRIAAFDYDQPSRRLFIKFQPNSSGELAIFSYDNVTQPMILNFQAAKSKGGWLAKNIDAKKDAHPYRRVGTEIMERTQANG